MYQRAIILYRLHVVIIITHDIEAEEPMHKQNDKLFPYKLHFLLDDNFKLASIRMQERQTYQLSPL